jgi:Heterokaryon incompatibility protein (HET)
MHRGEIPVSSLATTFRDALDITLKLGLKFIWIDSLCIVQNDPEERSEEFPKIGDVYGGAYFVIAATHATDGSVGCYKDRPRFHRVEFETPNRMSVKAICREKIKHEVWKTSEQFWEALELPLLGRAWALQERLLATRVVHFTPSELVWECRSGVDCECGDLQNPRTKLAGVWSRENFQVEI